VAILDVETGPFRSIFRKEHVHSHPSSNAATTESQGTSTIWTQTKAIQKPDISDAMVVDYQRLIQIMFSSAEEKT
jgi:hypothetical protein